MKTYKVVFTIKQAIHPLTEVVTADSIEEAEALVKGLIVAAKVTLKQIVSIVQQ